MADAFENPVIHKMTNMMKSDLRLSRFCAIAFLLLVVTSFSHVFLDAVVFVLRDFVPAMIDTSDLGRKSYLFFKSFFYAGLIASLSTILGSVTSYCLARFEVRCVALWLGAALFPLLIPANLYCLLWTQTFANEGLLGFLNITFSGPVAMVFLLSLYHMPIAFLSGLIGVSNIERNLEEYGSLYWNSRKLAMKITLPLLRPYFVLGWIVVFILTLNEYGIPLLLGVNVFSTEVFLQFNSLFHPEVAVFESCVVLGVILIVVAVAMRYFSKRSYVTIRGAHETIGRKKCGCRETFLVYTLLIIMMAVSFLMPIYSLLGSITTFEIFKTTVSGARGQILNSLLVSTIVVAVGATAGFLIAYYLYMAKTKSSRLFGALLYFVFAVPSMIIGIGIVLFWNRKGALGVVYSSVIALVLGLVVKYLPLMIKAIHLSMEQRAKALEEAASICGLSFFRRCLHITAPLNLKGLLIGAALIFVLSMNDLNLCLLLSSPGRTGLSVRLFTLMHYAPQSNLMSLGLCLIAINLAACGVLWGIYKVLNRCVSIRG